MRVVLVALLVLPLFSGCLNFTEDPEPAHRDVAPPSDTYNPDAVTIDNVIVHDEIADLFGSGGVALDAVIYQPVTASTLPDGTEPAFPVLVFLHAWGMTKEIWQTLPIGETPTDVLQRFAESGFVVVAYDARGFGQSGGQVTAAGPAEVADIRAVINYAEARFHTNGYVGVIGHSYGAGQALLASEKLPEVDAVVSFSGWTDLYNALLPNNVPKIGWDAYLLGTGNAASQGRLDPMIRSWMTNGVQRNQMTAIQADMAIRNGDTAQTPVFACQGQQEGLFTDMADILSFDTFVRARVFTGGHATQDATCWDRALDWFMFFLRGKDTMVDTWPFLETVGTGSDAPIEVSKEGWDNRVTERRYLRDEVLSQFPSAATFEVEQQILNNPFAEPSGFTDVTQGTYAAIPYSMREDPTANDFRSSPAKESRMLLGAPTVGLTFNGITNGTDMQVVVQLYHLDADDNSRLIGRSAYAYRAGHTETHDGTIEIQLGYAKTQIAPGDTFVLRVGANDVATYEPFPGNYAVTFTGASYLDIPYFS